MRSMPYPLAFTVPRGGSYGEGMNIEELAANSQHQFEVLHAEMATKAELRALERTLLHAIDKLGLQIAEYQSLWKEEFDNFNERVQGLEDAGSLNRSSRCA